jgi:hypothetical protein
MVKSASSRERERKLNGLGHMIKGTSCSSAEIFPRTKVQTQTKSASLVVNNIRKQGPIEKTMKLRELGKMIRGL